jgi:cytoskeletal protein RodZ
MTPHPRTPQQRDRRFARVRRLTSSVFLGSGVASGVLVGFMASSAKPVVETPTTTSTARPSTTTTQARRTTSTTPPSPTTTSTTTTTRYVPPTTVPTTTTTICYTNPSGHLICS